jgi:hypothetical protein
MDHIHGLSVGELSDADLERQVDRAHATRNWVFLHGTARQYRRHTERMLELEQEYLRRHPQRTWQGSVDGETRITAEDRIDQIREVLQMFQSEMSRLVNEVTDLTTTWPRGPGGELTGAEAQLLDRFARCPEGRMHKLEAHHIARELGIYPSQLALLYRQSPALLAVDGADRYLTDAGRASLAAVTASRAEKCSITGV